MFIRRKKYNELLEQKNEFERIATNAVAQNGRLLDEWHDAIEEMKSIQKLNHDLIDRNEELLDHIEKLKARLILITKQRDELENECKCLEMDLLDAEMTIAAMEKEQENRK